MEEVVFLFCYVPGDSVENVFSVKIGKNESISELKKAIKAEMARFANTDANELTLWKASISYDDLASTNFDFKNSKGLKKLRPIDRISVFLGDDFNEDHIHVIVQPPVIG